MQKKGLLLLIGTLPFLSFATFGFFKVLEGGVPWRIACASIGLAVALLFSIFALRAFRKGV